MTDNHNRHARKVTVSRTEHRHTGTANNIPQHRRKAVAVRLRDGHREPPAAETTVPPVGVQAGEAAVPTIEEQIPAAIVTDAAGEDISAPAADDIPYGSAEPAVGEPDGNAGAEDTAAGEEPADGDTEDPADDAQAAGSEPADEPQPQGGEDTAAEAANGKQPSPTEEAQPPADSEPAADDAEGAADDGDATVGQENAADGGYEADGSEEEPSEAADDEGTEDTADSEPGDDDTQVAADSEFADDAEQAAGPEEDAPAAPYTYPDPSGEDAPPPVPGKWYIPQRWKDITMPRRIIMILAAALGLFSCLPLFVGVVSPGILPPLMIAAFFFLCALYWPLIDGCESTWGNVLIAVVAVCVLAGVTYLSFVSGKMISASTNTLPEDRSDVTVVVLGCRIHGDRPSRMLHARLETAAEFLLEHPQAHCIVSGGQGEDEDFPEALVMKNWLVDKGVSPMRIVMESKSTSTLENITLSAEKAEQYNCHERFLIVTDRFHQYRAMSTANDLGIVSYALNVETAWYLAMPYWFREMAAITRDWITS